MKIKRNKKHSTHKRARQQVVGLIVRWYDTSPLMDTTGFMPGTVTHRNPIYKLLADQMFSDHKNWIVEVQPFFWKVTLTVIFDYPNGQSQHETRELYAHCRLCDISATAEDQLKDAMRHGNEQHYKWTEFQVECLGLEQYTIEDNAA